MISTIKAAMDEQDFEGTIVLEKIAEIARLDEFFEAIDSDDFAKVKSLLREAHIDQDTIQIVINKMIAADGDH